jgi:hypothetical protein
VTSKFTELCIDCAEPEPLARFWCDVLGYEVDEIDEDEVSIKDPSGSAPLILFLKVPEAKSVKNRLHIDVNAVDMSQDEEVERIIGLGARRVDIGQGEQTWVVLADPEGNEFCVLRSRAS